MTIDGVTYEQVGHAPEGQLVAAGHRRRRRCAAAAVGPVGSAVRDHREPETLPWLIRLDKFVEGQ